jgi:hypothetical protein
MPGCCCIWILTACSDFSFLFPFPRERLCAACFIIFGNFWSEREKKKKKKSSKTWACCVPTMKLQFWSTFEIWKPSTKRKEARPKQNCEQNANIKVVVVEKWHKLSESRVRVYSRREFGLSSFSFFTESVRSCVSLFFFVICYFTGKRKFSCKRKKQTEIWMFYTSSRDSSLV